MSEPPEGKGLIRTIKRIPVLCAVFLIKFYQMAISSFPIVLPFRANLFGIRPHRPLSGTGFEKGWC